MRKAIQRKNGQWRIVEEIDGVFHLRPLDWGMDSRGFWPRVELVFRDLDEKIPCPNCREQVFLDVIECVYGINRREGWDVVFLERCLHCRLPVCIRVKGFINNFPDFARHMENWASWEERKRAFDEQERKYYGELLFDNEGGSS
jgi:hypothetical protein